MKFNFNKSELKRFTIELLTNGYDKKEGFGSFEERKQYEDELYPKLNKGFYLFMPSNPFGNPTHEDTDGSYIEFSPGKIRGHAKENDIKHLIEIVDSCSLISVESIKTQDVYSISSQDYRDILLENTKEISDWIDNNPGKDGIDWARENRIERITLTKADGFDDRNVDVKFVNDLIVIKRALEK